MNKSFGVSTLIFREYSLEKALEKIKKTNFSVIDLSIVPPTFCPHYLPLETNEEDDKKLKDLIDKSGLSVSTLNIVPGYFNKDNPEKVSQFIKRSICISKTLGAHSITIPSGFRVSEDKWIENVNTVKKYLIDLAKYAEDNGVKISVETPHLHTLTETIEESIKFHEILSSDLIKCTIDTSHLIAAGSSSIAQSAERIGFDKINHIHLRDAKGRDITFTPGKGDADFEKFIHTLKKNNYSGNLIFELEYEDYSTERIYEELDFTSDYLNKLYDEEDIPFRLKLKTNKYYQFFERLKENPKKEIKRYPFILTKLQKIKPTVLKLFPDDVYEGVWKKKYRFNKEKVVVQPPRSVIVKENPDKILKVGIIGCGWAGSEMHAPGFQRLNNVELVGGFDIDKSKTEKFAKRFNCAAYNSYEDLVKDAKPDIVAICSREWAHYEPAKYLLENGVDVFCEKIIATKYSHAKEMVEIAKKNNRVLGINYNYRFMPGVKKIKEVIETKALGKLLFFNINVHAMSYAHAIDLLSYFGGKINYVSGTYQNDDSIREFGNTDWSLYDDDILYVPSLNASVTCEFDNGAVGVVNSTYLYHLYTFILSIEAVFELGSMTLNGINMFNTLGNLSYFAREKNNKVDMNYKKDVYAKGYEYNFYSSVESFVRNYVNGKPPETPGEQGLLNVVLEKAISKSSNDKVKVDFNEFINELNSK